MTMQFSADEEFAKQLDSEDPLRAFQDKFHLPLGKDGKPLVYFAGNSLGLMPKAAKQVVDQELDDWARLGVDAHLDAKTPWYSYHETLREPTARLIGAEPVEVICMNSLTVNLHLMMATFYRPTKSGKNKILMEDPAFPSDTYAIKTQIAHHGLDPKDALVLAGARMCTSSMRRIRNCRVLPAGLETIPIRDFDCISSRSLFQSRRPTVGRLAIRPFFRWRRYARRCRSLMKRAGWTGSARNRSN